jgi:nucleotide-binding universal stress UspA family protein
MYPVRTILHPTDFSKHSERAFDVACALLRGNRARLVVLHVAPIPERGSEGLLIPAFPEQQRESLIAQLKQIRAIDPNLQVEHLLEFGDTISRVARDTGAGLIVVGSHGRSGVRRLLLGSVAEALVRLATCSVMVVKKGSTKAGCSPAALFRGRRGRNEQAHQREEAPMFSVKTILHPTDLSESAVAYQVACDLARQHKADLIALHITPKGVVSYVDTKSELSSEETKEKLWKAIRRPREEEAGVNVTHRLEEGDAIREIVRVAQETHCDLIVMGTHGRSVLTRWFSSSTSEEVIRKAPCSVFIVKARNGEVQPAAQTASVPQETEAAPV